VCSPHALSYKSSVLSPACNAAVRMRASPGESLQVNTKSSPRYQVSHNTLIVKTFIKMW
jgi:hypothetical protein